MKRSNCCKVPFIIIEYNNYIYAPTLQTEIKSNLTTSIVKKTKARETNLLIKSRDMQKFDSKALFALWLAPHSVFKIL